MIYKMSLFIWGDNFEPDDQLPAKMGDLMINSYHSPQDKTPLDNTKVYGYGGITFWHIKKFALDTAFYDYENAFVEFLVSNGSLFSEKGASNFVLQYEIYHDHDQCNFEILNPERITRLSGLRLSLPVSVYKLDGEYYQQWAKEIMAVYETDRQDEI